MTKRTTAPGVRQRKTALFSQGKHSRMLATAVDVFFAEGYHASMDQIAAKARVAKQTVYNHFGSKEQLFAEVVQHLADTVMVSLGDPELDVHTALLKFSIAVRGHMLSPKGIGAHRALVSEAPRFPKLAALIYTKGHQAALDALAEFIDGRMAAGQLERDDPYFAAQIFLGMLTGHDRVRLLYGMKSGSSDIDESAKCGRIVDCFLRAFRVQISPKTTRA